MHSSKYGHVGQSSSALTAARRGNQATSLWVYFGGAYCSRHERELLIDDRQRPVLAAGDPLTQRPIRLDERHRRPFRGVSVMLTTVHFASSVWPAQLSTTMSGPSGTVVASLQADPVKRRSRSVVGQLPHLAAAGSQFWREPGFKVMRTLPERTIAPPSIVSSSAVILRLVPLIASTALRRSLSLFGDACTLP